MKRFTPHLALWLVACALTAGESTNGVIGLSVTTRSLWQIGISTNGSGSIGWVACSHPKCAAGFPQGSLDFVEVRKVLEANTQVGTNQTTSLKFSLFRAGDSTRESRQVIVPIDWARALFTKAFALANKSETRVEELRTKYPPFSSDTRAPDEAESR